jgi:molybdate transport system substrate-binding protein
MLRSEHEVRISTGSSGHLYAQIVNGAPYDVFLSADRQRPKLIEQASLAKPGTRFTYAIGTLVLWVRAGDSTPGACDSALRNPGRGKVAIANPQLAPYGAAARQVLMKRHLWESLQSNLVYGENISQVLHFVVSGNADVAMLAQAQLDALNDVTAHCVVSIPGNEHDAIAQQAVLLVRAAENKAAEAFLHYLQGPEAGSTIRRYGYRLPGPSGEQVSQ